MRTMRRASARLPEPSTARRTPPPSHRRAAPRTQQTVRKGGKSAAPPGKRRHTPTARDIVRGGFGDIGGKACKSTSSSLSSRSPAPMSMRSIWIGERIGGRGTGDKRLASSFEQVIENSAEQLGARESSGGTSSNTARKGSPSTSTRPSTMPRHRGPAKSELRSQPQTRRSRRRLTT